MSPPRWLTNFNLNLQEARRKNLKLFGTGESTEEGARPSPEPPKEDLIGRAVQLQQTLVVIDLEYLRLLLRKDETVRISDYEQAAQFRDRSELARTRIDEPYEALRQLRSRAQEIRDDLRIES